MGILNVIKLANDYNKAKKLISSKKPDIEKAKALIEKVKGFVEYLYSLKDKLQELILEVKDVIKKPSDAPFIGQNEKIKYEKTPKTPMPKANFIETNKIMGR